MKKWMVCLLTVLAVGLFADGIKWQSNYDEALEKSKNEKKPMFVFFTGSDWCGWCMKLDKEILSKKEMVRYLNGNFILYKADFPRKNKPSKEVMEKNSELAGKYGIRGYPTIVITDGSGKKLGTTGYMRGGPSAMKNVLDKYVKKSE